MEEIKINNRKSVSALCVLKHEIENTVPRELNDFNERYLRQAFVDTFTHLVAWFHPGHLLNRDWEIALAGGDYVTRLLGEIFGDECADEHEQFRFYISTLAKQATAAPPDQQKEMTESEYGKYWQENFAKPFPALTAAIMACLHLAHSEVECERAFSGVSSIVDDDRSRLAALRVHASCVIARNYVVALLNAKKKSTLTLSGVFCRDFCARFLRPLLDEAIEAEKKNNLELRDGRARRASVDLQAPTEDQLIAQGDASADASAVAKRLKARKEAQTSFIFGEQKLVDDEVEPLGVKHRNTIESLRCGVCDKLPLEHADNFGYRTNFDWFMECNVCEYVVHSDCCGIAPQLRSRADNLMNWVCPKCIRTECEEKKKKAEKKKLRLEGRSAEAQKASDARKARLAEALGVGAQN